jgi:hypothetical protein
LIGDALGLSLDHDVQPLIPPVTAGGQDDVGVGREVPGLLFARARW